MKDKKSSSKKREWVSPFDYGRTKEYPPAYERGYMQSPFGRPSRETLAKFKAVRARNQAAQDERHKAVKK